MKHLELTSVSKSFGATRAVDGVSLELGDGKRLAVVGPSGCGKTTLLRLIAGFEFPDAGTISLNGEMIARVPAFRRGIGYLPQEGSLFPHLTVENNIGFGLGAKGRERAKRIRELMDLVSLDAVMLKRWPHELSGGQQQRVALARALARSPRLMLLDEPFSALDANLRATTRAAITAVLQEAGSATILVTHDRAEALSFPDALAGDEQRQDRRSRPTGQSVPTAARRVHRRAARRCRDRPRDTGRRSRRMHLRLRARG